MEILFVVENISEKCGANVNIVLNLIKKLDASNKISVLAKTNDFKSIDEKKSKLFDTCFSFYASESEYLLKFQERYSWNKLSFLGKMALMLMHPKVPIYLFDVKYFDSWLTRRKYIKQLQRVCKKRKIDVVIAVSAPYYLARVLADSMITSKKVLFQLDPYSYNYTMPQSMINRRRNIEKKVIKECDKVFAASFVYDEIKEKKIVDCMDKLVPFMLPGILVDEINKAPILLTEEKENSINFVFVGQFYDEIRNPQYLLELFSYMPENYILHIFGGGAEKTLERYRNKLGDRLICHGWVSAEEARRQMYNADVLVNVNNTIVNQMASKLFEYMGVGKPILNICKTEKCSSLKYAEKYPLCMNIVESSFIDSNLVNEVKKFVEESKERYVPNDKLLEEFEECTDVYVANLLLGELLCL